MPRTHGYSLKGTKCYGVCNWGYTKRSNVIGALLGKKLLTCCIFETTINSDVFYTWLTKDLLPKLKKLKEKFVIVMDNAAFHKRKDMLEAINKAGHILEFLPKYSPDLNPIEKKWAQLKKTRRKLKCSIDELLKIESFYLD